MLFHSKILFSVTTFIFTQEPYFHLKNLFYFIIFPDDFTFGPNLLKYKEHTSSVPHPLSTFIQYGFETNPCRNTGDSDSIPYKESDDEMNVYSKDKSREELSCPSITNISSFKCFKGKEKKFHCYLWISA